MSSSSTRFAAHRVLVTGATGLIGSRVVSDLLEQGADVVAFVADTDPRSQFYRSGDAERTQIVSGFLEDADAVGRVVTENETDIVVHLGAQTLVGTAQEAPAATFETNVRGSWNILEICRRQSDLVRAVVVASSDKAYGVSKELPYTETTPLRPDHPYEVSKACADMLARGYAETYGTPVGVVRCGNVYGPGDLNFSRLVPGTIRALLDGESPVIRSDGRFVREYVYVADASAACLALIDGLLNDPDNTSAEAFNFSTEVPTTVLEMVGLIAELMDRNDLPPVILNEAAGEIRDQRLSAAKARRILGWKPAWDLESGLAATIDWYGSALA